MTATQTISSSPIQAAPVAALDAVTKRYGNVTALDGLSLELYPGEIVALLGPNGAGKSTAIRLLLGLSGATSGTARIFGRDPRHTEARTRIGAMLQVASVPKTLKVREHIDLFRSYYPAPLAYAEIIRIAQLEGIEERLFEKLSGGQRQRLLFALALCGDPEIIFLDEPTVGMDIEARRGLWAADSPARRPRQDDPDDDALSGRGRRACEPDCGDRQGPDCGRGHAGGDQVARRGADHPLPHDAVRGAALGHPGGAFGRAERRRHRAAGRQTRRRCCGNCLPVTRT